LKDKKSISQLKQQAAEYMNTAEVRTEARIENKDDYLTIKIEPLAKVPVFFPGRL
jgi:hypothetical protein